jgi:hypothetical protein
MGRLLQQHASTPQSCWNRVRQALSGYRLGSRGIGSRGKPRLSLVRGPDKPCGSEGLHVAYPRDKEPTYNDGGGGSRSRALPCLLGFTAHWLLACMMRVSRETSGRISQPSCSRLSGLATQRPGDAPASPARRLPDKPSAHRITLSVTTVVRRALHSQDLEHASILPSACTLRQ